jgi:hypothetical protein
MANVFGSSGGKSGSSLNNSNRDISSSTASTRGFSRSSGTVSNSNVTSTNVFGNKSSSLSCNDAGISRVLPTSSEALQGSQTQAFPSSPNIFSKGENSGENANLRDFYTKSEIQKLLKLKADISAVYTEDEVDQLLLNLNAQINLNLADFITEAQADQKISDSYSDVITYLGANYYDRTALYTKVQIDNLLAGITDISTDDFILKEPNNTSNNTINPGSNNAIPLTLVASSNLNTTTVQHWIDSQSNSIGRIRNSGKVEFYGYMSLGDNIESWRPALNVNARRISGVANPVQTFDAVNKKYMEDFVVETVSDAQQQGGGGGEGIYNIDCLTY